MSIVLPDTTLLTNPAMLYSSWPAATTVTANHSAAGYVAGDILAASEDTGHRFNSAEVGGSYVIDAGAIISADYLAICGTPLAGQYFHLSGSDDNSTWVSLFTAINFTTEDAAWVRFDLATYRYWKLFFGVAASNFEVNHVALGLLAPWPYFNDDYDANSLDIDGAALVSSGGYHAGGVVQAAQRKMPITPGLVSASELEAIVAFAGNVIRYQRGCFFVPQISEDTIYYGYMDDTKFTAPNQKNGLYAVNDMTFVARAE